MKIGCCLEFAFATLGNHVMRFGNAGCRLAKTPVFMSGKLTNPSVDSQKPKLAFTKNSLIKLTYLRKSALRLHGSALLSALQCT